MKMSTSMELLWQLACREAIAGRFAAIEPEHFCMALTKFAELPEDQLERLDDNVGQAGKGLAQDAKAVREELAQLGVDGTQGRRKLRATLGKGTTAYAGGEMHRSEKSRVLFDEVARLADKSADDVLTPCHLLAALVSEPTPAIRDAFLLGAQVSPAASRSPELLSAWGSDLTDLAAKGGLVDTKARVAESRAFLNVLQSPARKPVFLVSEAGDPITELMASISCAVVKQPASARVKRLQVIDLTRKQQPVLPACPEGQLHQRLFAEVAELENLVLRIPDIQDLPQGGEILALLKTCPAASRVSWVCRVGDEVYRRHIQKDSHWRRAAIAIVIEQKAGPELPSEL